MPKVIEHRACKFQIPIPMYIGTNSKKQIPAFEHPESSIRASVPLSHFFLFRPKEKLNSCQYATADEDLAFILPRVKTRGY